MFEAMKSLREYVRSEQCEPFETAGRNEALWGAVLNRSSGWIR